MKMPVINFDEHFAEYMSEWMKNHEDNYANFDEMEDDMPRIYVAFLNTRARWLGNVTPGAYFTQFEDPKVLVDWLAQYCEEGAPVPDLLMEQITTVGRPCEVEYGDYRPFGGVLPGDTAFGEKAITRLVNHEQPPTEGMPTK